MLRIAKIYVTLTLLHKHIKNPSNKDEQLIAMAIYENGICNKYLVHQELLDMIYDNSNVAYNQVPEHIKNGLLGTNESFYYLLRNNTKEYFEYSDLETLSENNVQNILNEHSLLLISN